MRTLFVLESRLKWQKFLYKQEIKLAAAQRVVDMLKQIDKNDINKTVLLTLKQTLNDGGWKNKQLPDLLKAIKMIDTNREIALGYLYKSSFQGHPIERKIIGGSGLGVLKDLSKLLNE